MIVRYLLALTLAASAVCIYDKIASKKLPKHRVPEAVLFFLSVIGGSVGMLVTMLLIRHKTKHKRFMIGLPCIIFLQLSVCGVGLYLYCCA